MTVQQQALTSAQQKILSPRALTATGEFRAVVDGIPVLVQTKTLVHNFDQGIYGITGRHADNSVTVKEFYIQIPEDIEVDKTYRLEASQFTKIKVWYSVKSPTAHYTVQAISGVLQVSHLEHFVTRIRCAIVGDTDTDPNGNSHKLNIEFDLHT